MPPQITITREAICEAGLALVREQGLSALSARNVAQRIGCSTQPVYRAYRSMHELKEAVLAAAREVAMSYLRDDEPEGLPFLQIGFGVLTFAQNEPELYKAVTLSSSMLNGAGEGDAPPAFVVEKMRANSLLTEMSDEQLSRIHTLLWFFSHGLSSLFVTEDAEEDPMGRARELLMQAGRAVISWELKE